jgi:hypothetical protein
MEIQFKIVERIYPKLYEEFDSFIICRVDVVSCSKISLVGKRVVFKGYLPSCAPYFIFEGKRGVVWEEKNGDTLRCTKKAKFTLHVDLRKSGLVHMLMYEFPKANSLNQRDKVKRHTAHTALAAIQQMVTNGDIMFDEDQKIDVQFILQLPIMNEAVLDGCDLFRINYIKPIIELYSSQDGKIHKTLSEMSANKLQAIHKLLEEDPLRMCLKTVSKDLFGLRPLSYASLMIQIRRRKLTGKYKPYELCYIRILDFFRTRIVGEEKHTAISLDDLQTRYLSHSGWDKQIFLQSFWYAVRLGEFNYAKGIVCTPTHAKKCDVIVGCLTRMFEGVPGGAGIYRNLDAPVPCIPKTLTDEQTRAAKHLLEYPLTIVIGPPGRGKTSLVEFALCYFKRVCVASFVGTNVASHRERVNGRMEVSNTAHHIYHAARASANGRNWVASFDALVWDEFSNVSETLVANVLGVMDNLSRFCPILDPWQIHPLNPGMPGMDLIDRFPDCCFNLTRNLRTNPRARHLADAIMYILKGEPERIEWSRDLSDGECMTIVEAAVPGDPTAPLGEFRGVIYNLLQHIVNHPEVYGVRSIMDIQFVVFKNDTRVIINRLVEECARELGLLPTAPETTVELDHGLSLYIGCKIAIRGDNFNATRDGQYDNVRNGDCGVVTRCRLMPNGMSVEVDFSSGALQKRMLLDKRVHVDPKAVVLGHGITANASQGSEYNTVVGIVHDTAANDSWVSRGHVYVMSSRAREAFILVGNQVETAFERICGRVEKRRETKLGHVLKNTGFGPYTTPPQPFGPLRDVGTLQLDTDKKTPCVPVLEQFTEEKTREKRRKK